MRRRISLYIDGSLADIPGDATVLMNYAATDLTNPAILKNSCSWDFDLPRTPANDRIFGHSGRLDRLAGPGGLGPDFNASRKTPFVIYAETSEVLASGYIKLQSVTRDAYRVSLFGGLGDFLWGLSYDNVGEKKSLASMDYGETLDFTIDKDTVAEAWEMLANGMVQRSRAGTYSGKILKKDGTMTNASGYYVDYFNVKGGGVYQVTARQGSNVTYAPIAAYDAGGNFIKYWKDGDTAKNWTTQITVPANAALLYVQGRDSLTPALYEIVKKWDVINFAPAYNGIPSDFKADKALIDPAILGIVPPVTMDGESCDVTKGGGYALLAMTEAADEWQARDLRSYLQRPVLSVRKMLAAIAEPGNNGGWSVDLSDLASLERLDTWLTRPLLPSLGTYKQKAGAVSLVFVPTAVGTLVGQFTVSGADPASMVNATATVQLAYNVSAGGALSLVTSHTVLASGAHYRDQQVIFCQAVGYDSGGVMVAAGPVRSFYDSYYDFAPDVVAAAVGYTPAMGASFAAPEGEVQYNLSAGTYLRSRDITLDVSGRGMARIDILVTAAKVRATLFGGSVSSIIPAGSFPWAAMWTLGGDEYTPTLGYAAAGSATGSTEASDTLRSGATITKEMLLSTSKTPAEYLLALCKAFGLFILADGATRSVQILRRESFFQNTVTDLTGRVDARSVEITPLTFDAKWYELRQPSVGGRFETEYERTSGVQYGIMRLDTGYDFDASIKDLLAGSAIKSCAAVQDRGPWWFYAENAGQTRKWFGPVLAPGPTYSLWDATGKKHDAASDAPDDAATFTPYSNAFPGYDLGSRAEFRDGDNKPVDGADVLLVYTGEDTIKDINITDDTPAMDTLLGGPCWLVEANGAGLAVPQFTRYKHRGQDPEWLLDFGIPREVDIPLIRYPAGTTVYEDRWFSYIRDRLSVNGKTLRCRVLLEGLQVGPELLRRFYWYQGSLWSLVSISNYSLTTFDPAECEFVQVGDINNYLI